MNRRPVIVHLVSGLFVLAMASHPASGQEIVPSRFAYGMVIDTVGRVPLQQFVLPDTVYRIATRADLGDLRLFNAAGEPLAYAIDRQDSETESPPERIALPFFSLSAAAPSAAGDVRVEVRKTPSGTLVRVDDPPAVGEPAAVYVIDASGLDRPVHALTFTWDESSDDFLTQATLETSDDLTRWEPWGDAITLARLRRMGNVLVREQVDVPPRDAPYYRIRFQHTPPPLSRVTVTPAADRVPPLRRWVDLETVRTERAVFSASHDGVFPVDRVRVHFNRPNTLARIRIESANEPGGPWRRHFSGTVYRIEVDGQTLESPEIPVRLTQNRYWRIVAGQGSENDPSLAPLLAIGWTPARLTFLARGEGPYMLAFGNAEIGAAAFDSGDLPPLAPGTEAGEARPGAVAVLGGEGQRLAPMRIDWKTLLLWASLLAGVTLLGLLALHLMRQVQRDREGAR